MKRLLPVMVLLLAFAAEAKPPDEAPPPDEDVDALDALDEVKPEPRTTTAKSTSSSRRRDSDLTDDQAAALGFASLCCCLVFVVGLVGLIVWLVRRSSKPAQAAAPGAYPPRPGVAAPPPAAPGAMGMMQLSIFALALDPPARQVVDDALAQAGASLVPTTPEARGRLVREAARALLGVQPSWRQFGYGEKPGIPDLASAESSYRAASEDFRGRSTSVGATADGAGLVVVTLLVCSRRALLGVSRLDDPMQVRNVLEDRMKVGDADLLGTELLWAPLAPGGRVSEAEIGLRFPEMLPLFRPAEKPT